MTANLNMTLHSIQYHYYYVKSLDPRTHHGTTYKQQSSWRWKKSSYKSFLIELSIFFLLILFFFSEEPKMSSATVLSSFIFVFICFFFALVAQSEES